METLITLLLIPIVFLLWVAILLFAVAIIAVIWEEFF